jgi:uncharacterized surface protein with fasciclin (FAS1) repeats
VQAKNGVVHVIDKVLLPPSTSRNVVGIATGNTDFSTLVSLLTAAELVTTLGTDDVKTAFTVFAPNNAAFAKVDEAILKCLKEAGNKVRCCTRAWYTCFVSSLRTPHKCMCHFVPFTNNSAPKQLSISRQAVLANLLKYHVVSGTVVASALTDKQVITTIATNAANKLTFVADGTKLQTSGTGSSAIKTTNILGTNGVVHVSSCTHILTVPCIHRCFGARL